MDTIKIKDKKNVLTVAHRGLSGIERENTCAAFVAAGNRSYYGIETDVHVTSDGKIIVFHDDMTGRVAERDLPVENTSFDELRSLRLKDYDGAFGRKDLMPPSLEEYISICKRYGKVSVLELKNAMSREDVYGIYETVKALGHLENTVFISFSFENLLYVKEKDSRQTVQFLCTKADEACLDKLKENGMDIDIHFKAVDEELVKNCRERGVKVNVWTVDDAGYADYLIGCGIDFITTNILE